MALIQLGAFVTKIRGKINGSTFSANIAGQTVRNKTIPKSAASSARSNANNKFSYFNSLWLDINPSYRAAWAFYAQNFLFYNKLGEAVTPKANLVFATTNMYHKEVTGNIITAPPVFVTPEVIDDAIQGIRVSLQTAVSHWTVIDNGCLVSMFISPPFWHGKEKIMQARIAKIYPLFPVTNLTPILDFSTEFWAKYPWAQVGMKVWFAWRRVQPNCYAWSPFEYHLVTITN